MVKKKDSIQHADHSEQLTRLRRIKGQIEGVEKMVSEGRYCLDIVNQMRAITAALKSAESLIMGKHIRHCVKAAATSKNDSIIEEKILELIALFQKR